MERLTRKLPDGRNILTGNFAYVRNPKYGSFVEGYAVDKLAEYEDAEEQGLLLRLACKHDTTVFVIPTKENGLKGIAEMVCLGYSIGEPINNANLFSKNRFDRDVPKMYQPSIEDFGKTWFLTKSEAEQAFKRMESE